MKTKTIICDHPLIEHKIALLRDVNTDTKQFPELIEEISMLMAYEALKDIDTVEKEIVTPLEPVKQRLVKDNSVAVLPILRAGLGMVNGMLKLVPNAKVGHIGLYRDPKTLKPVEYYCKLPADATDRTLIVVDPLLATGGSAAAAIGFLKDSGCTNIKFCCLIAAPQGLAALQKAHPDVDIFIAALDKELNDHAYIVPGLGDAGDRIFGTE